MDDLFEKAIGPVRGLRFLDDYELAFATYAEAQNAMGALQEAMAEYELALNPAKTGIIDLPSRIEPEWVAELRAFSFRPFGKRQQSDFHRYFDRSYQLAREYPDAHVLNYALARIGGEPVDSVNWPIVQYLTFQAVLGEPKTFKPALQLLQHNIGLGRTIDVTLMKELLNRQVSYHAPIGHASEVAWALWAARVHNIDLEQECARELARVIDPVVILLALDCESAGLFSSPGLDKSNWLPLMDVSELYGPNWLLAYEASVKSWLPSASGGDLIAGDPFFNDLRTAAVSFYDPTKTALPAPHIPTPIFAGGGGGGFMSGS